MKESLNKYAKKITSSLLRLKESEDLIINAEEEHQYFARLIKDIALELTHRPVTLVITKDGKTSDTAPYDPLDYTLPQSQSKVLLHLYEANTQYQPYLGDFEDAPDDMNTMMKYSHLAEPIYTDRRIALPWASVPCFKEDDLASWKSFFQSYCFNLDPKESFKKTKSLNDLQIIKLHLEGENSTLDLYPSSDSHFICPLFIVQQNRAFFSSFYTDQIKINLNSSLSSGNFEYKTSIMGHELKGQLTMRGGKIYTQDKLLRSFLNLEESLNTVGVLVLSESEIKLEFGSNSVYSLNDYPTSEDDIDEDFLQGIFTFSLSLNISKITATTKSKEIITLKDNGKLLI